MEEDTKKIPRPEWAELMLEATRSSADDLGHALVWRGNRLIAYLDTSFLSQFTKVEARKLGASANAHKWRALLACLRREVQRGNLICPASDIQVQEALLRPELWPHFGRIQSELSKGYHFKNWMDILVHQAANQVMTYLRRPQDINLGWSALTGQAPPVVQPEVTKNLKVYFVKYGQAYRDQAVPARSFAEQYEQEKRAFIHASFLKPVRQLQALPTDGPFPDTTVPMLMLTMLKEQASIASSEWPRVVHFFESDLVDRIPFIRTFCSIYASLIAHESQRKLKEGDLLDVAALASVLPYCSIVTTDTNMKTHIVKRLHLDTHFGADVFAPTAEDTNAFLQGICTIAQ